MQDALYANREMSKQYGSLQAELLVGILQKAVNDGKDIGGAIEPFSVNRTLRWDTFSEIEKELKTRKQKNPVPTKEELNMGTFIEGIEPQVRDAVLDFYRKGYSTQSSGFYGSDADHQAIEGFFTLDDETQRKLKVIGVEVELCKARIDGALRKEDESGIRREYTVVRFKPKEPNLEAMKEEWTKITALIPDKGEPAPPNIWGNTFRKEYEHTGKVTLEMPE